MNRNKLIMHQQTVSELDHMDTHYEKIANAENKKNKNKTNSRPP